MSLRSTPRPATVNAVSSTVLYVSVTAIGFLLAGAAAALAIGTAFDVKVAAVKASDSEAGGT